MNPELLGNIDVEIPLIFNILQRPFDYCVFYFFMLLFYFLSVYCFLCLFLLLSFLWLLFVSVEEYVNSFKIATYQLVNVLNVSAICIKKLHKKSLYIPKTNTRELFIWICYSCSFFIITFGISKTMHSRRCIENPAKHLRRSVLRK